MTALFSPPGENPDEDAAPPPAGPAPEPPPDAVPLTAAHLLALCGELEMLEHELSRLHVELDALRRRVRVLERRGEGA